MDKRYYLLFLNNIHLLNLMKEVLVLLAITVSYYCIHWQTTTLKLSNIEIIFYIWSAFQCIKIFCLVHIIFKFMKHKCIIQIENKPAIHSFKEYFMYFFDGLLNAVAKYYLKYIFFMTLFILCLNSLRLKNITYDIESILLIFFCIGLFMALIHFMIKDIRSIFQINLPELSDVTQIDDIVAGNNSQNVYACYYFNTLNYYISPSFIISMDDGIITLKKRQYDCEILQDYLYQASKTIKELDDDDFYVLDMISIK